MKATIIMKDKTDLFYAELAAATDKWAWIRDAIDRASGYNITLKAGNGSFRDRVELNQCQRSPYKAYKLESRRGYQLATFEW